MATFEIRRDVTEAVSDVYDVTFVDTANPFGDYAVLKLDDRGGQKFDNFARGTRVDIYLDGGYTDPSVFEISAGQTVSTSAGTTDEYDGIRNAGTYANAGTVTVDRIATEPQFTGYVVERRENEQSGADALEVEAYSFDQFLRRNTVTNDQRGNTISEALADIIQTDTPVTFNAPNVSVGDDQELTRSYQGIPVEDALRDFAFKSNNEDFGVNDATEFYFRPLETEHIDRGIDNTQWFRYDIPELGKETINEVEVWYDDGEKSVIVDDGTDKLDLQDNLSLPSPGTQRAELNRPLITDITDAEDIGRKYLTFRTSTLSGTVTTFELYDAEPGDTIDITITSRGIDAEFIIAGIEYRWGRDETILTIVERRGDVDDILSELNDSVQRVEMEGAQRDAPKNRITTTNATGIVSVDINADGNTPDADRFVNDGRRAVRDTWAGEAAPNITTLVVGSDGAGLSRSNTALNTQTNSATVSQTLPDATSVEFSASITQTGVEEVGLEAADGTLITRATFDTAVDLNGTVTVTLSVSNDGSVSRGVLTNDGQTAVRDVLADNTPALPDQYAYGDSQSGVAETDTALGNELVSVSLDDVTIQDADTQADWGDIVPEIDAGDPVRIDTTGLGMAQVAWTREGENFDRGRDFPVTDPANLGDYSGGDAAYLSRDGDATGGPDNIKFDFTVNHTIPAKDFNAKYRIDDDPTNGLPEVVVELEHANGRVYTLDTIPKGVTIQSLLWIDIEFNNVPAYDGPDLEPGDYTLSFTVTDSNGTGDDFYLYLDAVAPYDARYESELTFDNTNDGAGGPLDGPERYPASIAQPLETATTRRDVTAASFTSTWNDTSGNQYVELANDGTNYTRSNNTDAGSVTFAAPEPGVDTIVGLSRYTVDATTLPATGDGGQRIDSWNLSANTDATVPDDIGVALTRGIVPPDTLAAGTTLREAGLKSGTTLLTRHILAEFDVLAGQRIASAENTLITSDN